MDQNTTATESAGTPQRLTAKEFQEVGGTEDWRVLGMGAAAWFGAPSHSAGAELAVRAAELAAGGALEASIRSVGVQVRLPLGPTDDGLTSAHVDLARAVSAAAKELGLEAEPALLQDLQLAMDAMDQAAVQPFWEAALGYDPVGEEDLLDPLHRHPPIWFQDQDAPRPLRNRVHLDSVMPQEVATATIAALRERGASAMAERDYYATVADAEGNEVDILPLPKGADRWQRLGTEDWRLVFSAMACYPLRSAAPFVPAVATLADEAGLPLVIDVRRTAAGQGLVVLDTGKDRWEMEDGYEDLAARVQETAREMGLSADVAAPRFVQIGIDAVDIPAVREFWRVALGYQEDPRADVTDIVDPRGVNVPLFLQDLDADDEARRAQRNRIHVDLFLPHDQLQSRLEATLAAGGTVVRDAGPITWTVSDPEGNEIDLTTAVGREEQWAAQQG
ncbi:VOC family protein [Ornithinimicrobium murale]|uniref:VOC family protein n=1 Tax=Ornithinimicrobium murale TaxID=1050153 RepID=UPI0013B45C8E|nr:VOC family protein [Ornithinimicrobium murale]